MPRPARRASAKFPVNFPVSKGNSVREEFAVDWPHRHYVVETCIFDFRTKGARFRGVFGAAGNRRPELPEASRDRRDVFLCSRVCRSPVAISDRDSSPFSELTLVASLIVAWSQPAVRFWLLIGLASYALMRIG